MKKKIISILICIGIILGGGVAILNFKYKPAQTVLTENQVKDTNLIMNKFIMSIENNNYNEYKNITDSKIGTEENFSKAKKLVNDNLGKYKTATYKQSIEENNITYGIYYGSFSKKDVQFDIGIDKEGKVVGFHFK